MSSIYPATPNWPAVLAMTAGVFGMVASEMLPAGMLTSIASDLDVSTGLAGQAVTTTALVALVVSLLVPSATARLDRRHIVWACSLLLVTADVIVAAATSYYGMLVGRVMLGAAIGGFWSVSSAVAVRLVPESTAAKALSIVFGGVAMAGVVIVPLSAYLVELVGWRAVFWCAAALACVGTIAQFASLPCLPPVGHAKLSTIKDVLWRRGIAVGIISSTSVYAVNFGFQTYLQPLIANAPGGSPGVISLAFLVLGSGGFLGTLLSPVLMERSLQRTLTLMPVVIGAMGVLLVFSPNGTAQQMAAIFIWGFAFGTVPVAWSLWLTRTVPDQRETASSIFVAAVQIAIAVGAGAGGVIFDSFGGTALYVFGAVLVIGGAPAVYRTTTAAWKTDGGPG